MIFLHCFIYYILYQKLRNFFKKIIFREWSPCQIYSWVHVTLSVLNTNDGFFSRWRDRFLLKANKRGFQLKREVYATCLASSLPDVSLARQFNCLAYHLSDKLKIRCKFSTMSNKFKVLVSFVRYSSCPYGSLNKVMCFV